MEKELRHGPIMPSMMECIRRAKSTVMAILYGRMVQLILAILLLIILKDKESTIGLMAGNTRANGTTTKWKDMEYSHGPTAASTVDIMLMTKRRDRVSSFGLMVENMMAVGRMVNNMGKEYTHHLRASKREVSGRRAKE